LNQPYKTNSAITAPDHLSRLYHEDALEYIQLRNFIIRPKELNEDVQALA